MRYFNDGVHGPRDYLAKALEPDALGNAQALALSADEIDALVLFLRALDGDPVDGTVAAAPP